GIAHQSAHITSHLVFELAAQDAAQRDLADRRQHEGGAELHWERIGDAEVTRGAGRRVRGRERVPHARGRAHRPALPRLEGPSPGPRACTSPPPRRAGFRAASGRAALRSATPADGASATLSRIWASAFSSSRRAMSRRAAESAWEMTDWLAPGDGSASITRPKATNPHDMRMIIPP